MTVVLVTHRLRCGRAGAAHHPCPRDGRVEREEVVKASYKPTRVSSGKKKQPGDLAAG